MRIGVVTFFDNGNYGSELQAIATNEFCKSRGHEVTFLRIYPSNRLLRYLNNIHNRFSVWYNCRRNAEYRKVNYDRIHNSSAQANISQELKSYISKSVHKYIKGDNISSWHTRFFSPYDCYICGSDQVWSALRQPVWTCNFLGGVSSKRKIAYAPSIGVNNVPDYYIKAVAPLVSDFKYLSVREESVAQIFEKRIEVRPQVVVDPTMLLGKDVWEQLLEKEQLNKPVKPYIFCYFLGEMKQEQIDFLNNFAGNRDIVILPYEHHAIRLNNGRYVLTNQFEFVNYIRYADYIFTDSFHGTVFSLMFNKEFAVFSRSHIGMTKQTSRIESLLNMVGLSERLVDNPDKILSFTSIDYQKVSTTTEHKRQESIGFFDNALKEVAKNINQMHN